MSDPQDTIVEPEDLEVKEPEVEEDEANPTTDLIDENIALLRAKLVFTEDEVKEKDEVIETLTKRLKQAMDMIEEDTKAALLEVIIPKTQVPESVLMLMSVEDLVEMKKVLDKAKMTVFKSGTPIVSTVKSPQAKLDSMNADYMAKFRK